MSQHLKEDVKARLEEAALSEFAARGFAGATVAGIARAAGISTGNVYHYYPDKGALFRAVVPASFARNLMRLVRGRVKALDLVADIRSLPAGSEFHAASEELLSYCLANRLRVVVLLGRSAGTMHDGFADALLQQLQRLTEAHFRGLDPNLALTTDQGFALDQIYRNWARAMVEILETFDDESRIRRAVDAYSKYHMAGLKGLLGPTGQG